MVLDGVTEEHGRPATSWLYLWQEHAPFAYARGEEFIRYADHARWAHLRDARLVSMRSGECLAYRVGNVFYDAGSPNPTTANGLRKSIPTLGWTRAASCFSACVVPSCSCSAS